MTPEQLRRLIEASGLSAREWARVVVGRDPRTVRRWLAGDAIPQSVLDFLERLESTNVTPTTVVLIMAR